MNIREATREDFDQIWPIFHEIAAAGETYAYPRDIAREQAVKLWIDAPRKTYVFEEDGNILGTYYIKTNQAGPGEHVCNCGYMVSSTARGRGLATAMCEHSQEIARALGYKAMQFNFVASSNEGAVRLWSKLGFAAVGRLPKAFHHPSRGYVDALVMYKWLETKHNASLQRGASPQSGSRP
jgi:ribosomal protein S18 acetylase RimI-like enzyme